MESARRLVEPLTAKWALVRKNHNWLGLWEFQLAVEEGCIARAATHLETLRVEPDECNEVWIHRLLLQYAVLREDVAEARRRLASVAGLRPFRHAAAGWDIVDVVDLALRAGIPPAEVRATLLTDDQEPAFQRVESLVEGLLLAEEHRPAEAAARLLTGLMAPDPWLPKFMVDHLRAVAAAQVTLTGDRSGARSLVTQAIDGLAKWPGWRRDRAEALARRLDGRSASEGALSSREREVALLIAEGLTNAELARRLYISPKTAAVHVSNILMKLNMASRAEVAAWAVRTGLATDA
jgi:DNA-binding NarL/FixJ family response regulator